MSHITPKDLQKLADDLAKCVRSWKAAEIMGARRDRHRMKAAALGVEWAAVFWKIGMIASIPYGKMRLIFRTDGGLAGEDYYVDRLGRVSKVRPFRQPSAFLFSQQLMDSDVSLWAIGRMPADWPLYSQSALVLPAWPESTPA